ncbi:MAG: Xaa-Pro peptidase family protein [Pseudomonadota bacterium]
MTDNSNKHDDNRIVQEGVAQVQSDAADDFCPHLPKAEFDLRISKAKELLVKHGLDAIVLFAEENKYYYGGFRDAILMFTDRWRHCIIVSQEHEPVFVGEIVLDSQVMKTTWIRDARYWTAIKAFRLPTRFIDAFLDTMISLKLDNKVIGMEYGPHHILQVGIDEIREIERSLPNAKFVSADKLLWEQKMIKTDWEIALMREMCAKAGRVLEKGWKAIRPGVTERDIHRIIWDEWVKEDMFDTPTMSNPVLFMCGSDGPGKWRVVTTPFMDRVIQKGDQGFSDGGPSYKGYWTDLQRCFYVGDKLPTALADLSRWGRDAYLNTVKNIFPGMRGCDVFKLAERETYRQDWNQMVPIEFVGHGIGTLNHEPPWLADNDMTELKPGMTLCVEVGCYGMDQVFFGNMPEDIWLVTNKGLELIGIDLPLDIWLCGG